MKPTTIESILNIAVLGVINYCFYLWGRRDRKRADSETKYLINVFDNNELKKQLYGDKSVIHKPEK